MPKRNSSGSETGSKEGSSNQGMSDYEAKRLERIAENKTRMEALGLRKIANSLFGSSQKSSERLQNKGKKRVGFDDKDEDYVPNSDDDNDDDQDNDDSGSDDDYLASGSRRKEKCNRSNPKKKVMQKKLRTDSVDVDDDALMQAIALSLQDSVGAQESGEVGPYLHSVDVSLKGKMENKSTAEVPKRRQIKKSFTSRVKMNKDDVVLHFFQFDEAGKGAITARDLERLAIAHDFIWSDKELADMINCFDSDEDGKLSLDDFQKIVERCNILQGSETS